MENSSNIGFLCDKHSPKPLPKEEIEKIEEKTFIGKYVKIAFRTTGDGFEHMWVLIKELCGNGNLKGILNNDPIRDCPKPWPDGSFFKNGDEVTTHKHEIESIFKED